MIRYRFVLLMVFSVLGASRLDAREPLRVFILAGQSNMQGHAEVSTFDHIGMDPATAPLLKEMRNTDGTPRICDNVWISSIGNSGDEEEYHGRLTAGYGARGRGVKIGPEFTFGIFMEQLLDQPILIIKTAWGGKSLHTDFRSPSAGPYEFNESQRETLKRQGKDIDEARAERAAATGRYYRLMLDHVQHVLQNIEQVVPDYDPQAGYELAGFVWFQGWNDMVDQGVYPNRSQPGGYDLYSELLAHFIRDVRHDLSAPQLPFVIGVMGVGGPVDQYGPEEQRYKSTHDGFRRAMAAPASLPEFQGNVAAVLTEKYWDAELAELTRRRGQVRTKAQELKQNATLTEEERRAALAKFEAGLYSPRERDILKGSSNAEYHYLGSAKIMAQIGKGFAEALAGLQPRRAWTASRLRGAPTPPEPFRVVPAFPGLAFDHPTSLQEIPGTGRLLVTEIGGRVYTFDRRNDPAAADPAIDLQQHSGGSVSLFSAALHPQFADNRFVFLCYVSPAGGPHTRVSRFTMSREPVPLIDPASETVIITWPSGGHNAGCLRFGPDGLLYIATGDGSGPNPPDGLTTGQVITDLLGAILRIDVDQPAEGKPYSVPLTNPFINHVGARGEIFGYGLRNPWKFGIDRETGEVFVADNGWETWEMIHLVGSGTNCGWPVMEGRARLRSEVPPGPTPITPPIRDHHHSEANSVIGGPVCRGSRIPELNGSFVYGDYITGTIWSVGRDADGTFVGRTLVDTDLRITEFLEASTGELFVVDYDFTGQIYRLEPNDGEDLSLSFPRLLSHTGLFRSLQPLEPAEGVVGYDVVVPRWMDGAAATRYVAIPGNGRIDVAANSGERGRYPDGTVFAKHLTLPPSGDQPGKPLETQILLLQRGTWSPYSYVWNDSGTEAELAGPGGTTKPVKWPEPAFADGFHERTWRTSAVNECRLCHNAGAGFVLGFTGNQLGTASGQLPSLLSQAVIQRIPDPAADSAMQLVDPADETADLNDRARSYLHANCSMCHHKGGNAIVSFFLTKDLPFADMNTSKGTNIGTFGMRDARIIVPGDPYRSVLMYRMSKLGYSRMPYIGSQVVDREGVLLMERWIRSLPHDSSVPPSEPLVPDSPVSQALAVLAEDRTDPESRRGAIRRLMESTEGALALMARMHGGGLPAAESGTVIETAQQAGSDVRGLFDDFIPESERKKTLGRIFEPSLVLAQTGDAARGRLIFFSDAARCRSCHHPEDAGLSVGPTLKDASRKYRSDAELLQHVMAPSLKIDEQFVAWIVVTIDGRVLTGLIDSQSDTEVVLRTADRQRAVVARADIEEMRRSTSSLMPEGVLADLTAPEAADLLAFIRAATQDAGVAP